MPESDETIYLRFLKEGGNEDMKELVVRHAESLMLFLCGMVHNMDDAEELMMDSFAIAASGTAKYTVRENSSFKTWLFAIGRNQAKMFLRKKRPFFVPLHETGITDMEPLDADILKEEQNRALYKGLSLLNPDYAQVLYLTYFEEMKPAEAGRVLGKNAKQIYNLLTRAKEALRHNLERMGFDSGSYR